MDVTSFKRAVMKQLIKTINKKGSLRWVPHNVLALDSSCLPQTEADVRVSPQLVFLPSPWPLSLTIGLTRLLVPFPLLLLPLDEQKKRRKLGQGGRCLDSHVRRAERDKLAISTNLPSLFNLSAMNSALELCLTERTHISWGKEKARGSMWKTSWPSPFFSLIQDVWLHKGRWKEQGRFREEWRAGWAAGWTHSQGAQRNLQATVVPSCPTCLTASHYERQTIPASMSWVERETALASL